MGSRRWTAEVHLGSVRDGVTTDRYVVVVAPASPYDTLADQTRWALRFAQAVKRLSVDADVRVVLFKTTKARGRERDRSWLIDGDRAVYAGA